VVICQSLTVLIDSSKRILELAHEIERKDFETMVKRDATYWFCEKTDGVRYLLVCCKHKGVNLAVLMDRKCDLYILPLKGFPRATYQGTLFDGEVAWNKLDAKFNFMIFDAVCVSGIPVWHLKLSQRVNTIRLCLSVYAPHYKDPILCGIKTFVDLRYKQSCIQLLQKAQECFDVDGIVLSPETDQVIYGRHSNMFKVKEKHTVDFIAHDNQGNLSIYNPQLKCQEIVARLHVDEDTMLPPIGCVCECAYSGQGDVWILIMIRKDKDTSNDRLTYDKTCLNIQEQLTLEEVFSHFSSSSGGSS
jgi:hypothetical protein